MRVSPVSWLNLGRAEVTHSVSDEKFLYRNKRSRRAVNRPEEPARSQVASHYRSAYWSGSCSHQDLLGERFPGDGRSERPAT